MYGYSSIGGACAYGFVSSAGSFTGYVGSSYVQSYNCYR